MRAGYGGARLSDDLRRLFGRGPAPTGDRALLDRFSAEGDEAAFEALVARHGPMVLGVCRRLAARPQDADDAFQATFLVLARKAGRVRDADRLGPWLYGVARKVASKSRARESRWQRRHRPWPRAGEPPGPDRPGGDLADLRSVVDDELGRLPARHREVLVLCLLEGATAEEAGLRLGCPAGTVKSRLARGRETLRNRLIGRGVAPAAAAVALSAAAEATAAAVPAALTRSTLAAALGSPGAVAPGVLTLTRGVATAMIPKIGFATTLVLGGLALAGLGASAWPGNPENEEPQAPGAAVPRAEAAGDAQATRDHIKQILLAVHNYANANNHLPPAAIAGPDGRANLSWRVALLPYLEEGALYAEFRLNEPWNSEHNLALIARMPDVYRTPGFPAPDGQTRLLGFAGPGAMLDGAGVVFPQVTDGTSNTAFLAVARDPAFWTKPQDLDVAPGKPVPALDATDPSGWQLGMADGAYHSVPARNPVVLQALVTRNGGEVIDWSALSSGLPSRVTQPAAGAPPAGGPTPGLAPAAGGLPALNGPTPTPAGGGMPGGGMMAGMPGGGPTPSPTASLPSIDERLRRLEDKVDRILQRLEPPGERPATKR